MDIPRFLGIALVVGLIGPLFWLGVNLLENWLRRKGFPLAGLDLFSLQSWRQTILKIRSGSRNQET
jgi:hypothetical protein